MKIKINSWKFPIHLDNDLAAFVLPEDVIGYLSQQPCYPLKWIESKWSTTFIFKKDEDYEEIKRKADRLVQAELVQAITIIPSPAYRMELERAHKMETKW
jgi:hypothetical protein